LGKPSVFAEKYYSEGVDELMYQDVVASLYERNSLEEFIEKTAENIFIPMTVGGGIRTIKDIRKILRAGADKVSINTAAIKKPEFIKEASEYFGSSTIVVSMEVIKQSNGKYLLFTDNGREYTGIDIEYWVEKIQLLGAGEFVVTSVDREGTMKGLDINLIDLITPNIDIPMICHGGIGSVKDFNIMNEAPISGIAVASAFHYNYLSALQNDESVFIEGNLDFLKSKKLVKKGFSVDELKKYMVERNINVRYS
jgi:cyclase